MTTTNNGGPAFPQPFAITASGEVAENGPDTCGMTIRDYFAAKAMQGMLAAPNGKFTFSDGDGGSMDLIDAEDFSRAAYMYADAMLRARSATEGDKS